MTPAGWSDAELGDVVEILDGRRVPINANERAKRPGTIPYYGATGQVGWIDGYIFDEELVLLGEDGAPFLESGRIKAYMVRGKSWVNNHAHVLKARGEIPNAFLLHQLNTIDYAPFVGGTTRLKLPQAPMRTIPLSIPPLSEQHRIVAAIEQQFTRLDAAAAALVRARANLKRYRAATLAAACEGRLVPTEAELARAEGREYESGGGLLLRVLAERETSSARASARPAAVEANELGEVPEGWTWATLSQLAVRLRNGWSVKPSATQGVPILRISAVRQLSVDMTDTRRLQGDPADYADFLVDPGDLLFIRYNGNPQLVGACGVVPPSTHATVHPDKLIRVTLSTLLSPQLIAAFLNYGYSREFLAKRVRTTAGQSGISGSDLKQIPIALPPLAEQHRIVAEIERRLSLVDKLETVVADALKRAAALRQSILKRAFEGKLVPQDPDDEPADVLLERIRAERAAIPANGCVPKRAGRKKVRA